MGKKRKNANRLVDIIVDYLQDAKRTGIDDISVATDLGGVQWALNAVTATDQPSSGSSQASGAAQVLQGKSVSVNQAAPSSSVPFSPDSPPPLVSGDTMSRANKSIVQDIPVYDEVETILREMTHEDKTALLSRLAQEVSRCQRCPELVKSRTQTVFGTGNPNATLMFVGEGPGADEDQQGVPFVGRSGQLLTNIITGGMKLAREDVYICNIVRCRPPGNRNPLDTEAICCRPFLDATIKVVAPQFICCLGSVAAHNLLATTAPIGALRGRVHDYRGMKVVCTYHPAYLLRNPPAKAQTWEDIKLLMREMKLL